MPQKFTDYNLLFSCPVDVYSECYVVIKAAVDDFNKYSKSSLSIGVNLTHWSTDSYPQSGGHPQALLNTQIVDSADAAIAVFWTRFGTPTDEYGSGTEEEIDRLINNNKQIFLYFLDKAVPPSMTDSDSYQEQRKQIAVFRKKYENKGIYWVVSDATALKEQFSQHLFLYFAKQVTEVTGTSTENEKSALKLIAEDGSTEAHLQHLMLSAEMGIVARKSSIIEKIRVAQSIILPPEVKNEEVELTPQITALPETYSKLIANLSSSTKMPGLLSSKKAAIISENDKSIVMEFCTKSGIDLEDSFWCFGGLQIESNQMMSLIGGGYSETLVGTDDKKQKYELISEIVSDIYEYTDSDEFYHKMDAIPYVELVVRNEGTTFDEDIEICLTLKHDNLMQAKEFPVPLFALEDIVDKDLIDNWLCPVVTANISEFEYSLTYASNYIPHISTIGLPFQQRDYEAEYKQNKKRYYDKIKKIPVWELFVQGETDTVKIQIRKLNQFRSMHLPSRLFFKSVPDRIEYSITAKYTPSVITGEITIMK